MVQCRTLGIFGMKDSALLPAGYNGTWDWIENKFTLVSVPDAGHFIQHDANEYVTKTLLNWLSIN